MKLVIDEFKTIPGVLGCCIYNSVGGVQTTNLPSVFKPDRLTAIGEQLFRLHSAGSNKLKELRDISIFYDEAVIVVRYLNNNLLLFVVCDPGFNQNLLAISFNLLEEELGATAANELVESTTLQTTRSVAKGPDIHSASLSSLLQEMKAQLGKVLGPMAGFIFEEAVDSWKQQTSPDKIQVEGLIELLNKEISIPKKITQYRELIDPILRKHQVL